MSFQIHALDPEPFKFLFTLNKEELQKHFAVRLKAREGSIQPCRVSLEDAQTGEDIILVNYQHADIPTPYRSSHAIYIRKDASKAILEPNQVPFLLSQRLLSLRAFNAMHFLVTADVVEGKDLRHTLDSMFKDQNVNYIHIHYAQPGCYAAKVSRA